MRLLELSTFLGSMGISPYDITWEDDNIDTRGNIRVSPKMHITYRGAVYYLPASSYRSELEFAECISRILGTSKSREWVFLQGESHRVDQMSRIVYLDKSTLAYSVDKDDVFHHVGWHSNNTGKGPRGIHYQGISLTDTMSVRIEEEPDWVKGNSLLYDYLKHPGNKKYWDEVHYLEVSPEYEGNKVWSYAFYNVYMVNIYGNKWMPVSHSQGVDGLPEDIANEIIITKALLDI